jgi:hypothetical protein
MSHQCQCQNEPFALSASELAAIQHEMHHYEDPRAATIEALKLVQKERGWVPDGAIYAIAVETTSVGLQVFWQVLVDCFHRPNVSAEHKNLPVGLRLPVVGIL